VYNLSISEREAERLRAPVERIVRRRPGFNKPPGPLTSAPDYSSQYESNLSALLNVALSRHILAPHVQAARRIHYNDKAENIKHAALQVSGASRVGSLFDRATDCHVKLTV
jgi:hypothetical protein